MKIFFYVFHIYQLVQSVIFLRPTTSTSFTYLLEAHPLLMSSQLSTTFYQPEP